MSEITQRRPSAYRWLMLLLISLPNFGTNYAQFQLSAFAAEFMADFGLNATQFSAVTLGFSLAAGIIGVCGGTLADKLGTKRVVVTLGFVTSACALLRLLCRSYTAFFLLSLGVGCMLGSIHATSGKIINAWFPPREAGLAFSLYCAVGAAGISGAQLTFPLYAGYRPALLTAGCILALTTVAWLLLGKNAPDGTVLPPSQPVLRYIGKVVKLRNVWLVALSCACFCALLYSLSALLPQVLVSAKGLDAATANTVSSLLNITAIVGSVAIPPLQARLGKYRPLLIGLNLLAAAALVPLWFAGKALVLPLVCLLGLFVSVGCAFFMAILSGLKEVGSEYLGSATGIVTLVQYMLGGFLLSSFVIAPLMERASGLLFVCGAALCVIMAAFAALLPETGEKG